MKTTLQIGSKNSVIRQLFVSNNISSYNRLSVLVLCNAKPLTKILRRKDFSKATLPGNLSFP